MADRAQPHGSIGHVCIKLLLLFMTYKLLVLLSFFLHFTVNYL